MALNFGRALMGAHATGERQKLQKEQEAWLKEQKILQDRQVKKAEGKSLWGSWGSKLGAIGGGALGSSLLTLALTPIAGPAAPALAAAIGAGVGSFAGGKAGTEAYGAAKRGDKTYVSAADVRAAGPEITGGTFHSGKRSGLESSIGRDKGDIIRDMRQADRLLHEEQLMAALTDAATAGAMKGGSDWMGDLFKNSGIGETIAEEGVDMFFDPEGVSTAVEGIDYIK